MLQKIKMALLTFSALFAFSLPLAAVGTASAVGFTQDEVNSNLCSGTNGDLTGGSASGCDDSTASEKANSLVRTVVNILSVIVGVVAVIMIIIGGFRYITSGGKQESVSAAKNTILYALIGLIIVALAQIIVHFVLGKATAA